MFRILRAFLRRGIVYACLLIFIIGNEKAFCQQQPFPTLPLFSLALPDSVQPKRLWTTTGVGVAGYTVAMTALYKAWYADYPLGRFHTFNDNGEWLQMDKTGHFLMAYQESKWGMGLARWVGFSPRKSAWIGFATGQLIQTSFEVFDGFSTQWGWSWGDIACNLMGSSLFTAQQLIWKEQRISLKMSAMPVSFSNEKIYPVSPVQDTRYTTLDQRAAELYGKGPGSLFLKNYNALAVWISANPRSFMPYERAWWPKWLNVAVGMGADNMFAGYGYQWRTPKDCTGGNDCLVYQINRDQYPRTRQIFFSLDLDLSKIPVKNRFLRYLLSTANIFKIPAPTLEWRSGGAWRLHPVYF